MARLAFLLPLFMLSAACGEGGDAADPVPAAVTIVPDTAGLVVGSLTMSPDGSRLAWARTVRGRSAIFVSAPDGSDARQLSHGVWDFNPVWSPDGRWIAYYAESPDFDLMVVPADGGPPRQLTSGPARDLVGGWLPDGSAAVVFRRGDGPVHTLAVPLDGGPARRLGPDLGGDQWVAVSPDGQWIAFDLHRRAGEGTIWVQALDGSPPRQLTTEGYENADTRMIWSPDSRSLLYTSRRTGTRDLYVVDIQTGVSRQITSDIRDDFGARWSPDGRWIAFLSDRGGQRDVWIVPSTGGTAVRVTNDPALEAFLHWSRDGGTLYFHRSQQDGELRLLPLASEGSARTVVSWPGFPVFAADLAPDGQAAIFSSRRSGTDDLWRVSLAGGEPTPFAPSPTRDFQPRYSPDGTLVAFLSLRSDGQSKVWLAPPDTGGPAPRPLTDAQATETEHAWSPDGSRIAFASDLGGPGGDVWVAPVAGGEARRLTTGNLRPASLVWSRDGSEIYFAGERPGGRGRELLAVSSSGGSVRRLGASGTPVSLDLSPDGKWLAYANLVGGWGYTEVVPVAGGRPRRLTAATEGVYQFLVRWMPDGASLVVADLDFEGNQDNAHLSTVRLADGVWSRLTPPSRQSEAPAAFTADGRQLLVVVGTISNRIVGVSVGELLARAGSR